MDFYLSNMNIYPVVAVDCVFSLHYSDKTFCQPHYSWNRWWLFFFKLINWQLYSIHLYFLGFFFAMHYTTLFSLQSFNKSMTMETWLIVSKNESVRPNETAPTLCWNYVRKCSVLHLLEWSTWQTSYFNWLQARGMMWL